MTTPSTLPTVTARSRPLDWSHGSVTVGGIAFVIKKLPGAPYAYYGIEVDDTTGDITIKSGATSGAAAADPVFGASGVYDVSTAPWDTFQEILANINGATGSYLRAAPVDVAGAWSSNNTIIVLAATEITAQGIPLYLDPGVAMISGAYALPLAVTPLREYASWPFLNDLRAYPSRQFVPKRAGSLSYFLAKVTGTPTLVKVYAVNELDGTTRELNSRTAAATTVANEVTFTEPLVCRPGEYIIVAVLGSAAHTVASINVTGSSWQEGQTPGSIDRVRGVLNW